MSDLLGSHRSTNYLGGKCPVLGHINCNDSGFPILGTPAGCRTIYHFAGPESSGYFDLKAERRLLSLRRNVALRGLSLTRRHHPMGDAGSGAIHFSFNPQLRVEFWGATVTSTSVWVRSSRATSPNVVADAVANSGGWISSASLSTAAWRFTRTPTTRSGWPSTLRFGCSRPATLGRRASRPPWTWFETNVRTNERNYHRLPHLNARLLQHATRG